MPEYNVTVVSPPDTAETEEQLRRFQESLMTDGRALHPSRHWPATANYEPLSPSTPTTSTKRPGPPACRIGLRSGRRDSLWPTTPRCWSSVKTNVEDSTQSHASTAF